MGRGKEKMNNPWDIIKALESDNSRLKKEAIIKSCLLYTSDAADEP